MVISVGIDVSKDKHDCFIVSSEGEVLADVSRSPTPSKGSTVFYSESGIVPHRRTKIKVGLEATGHYSLPSARFSS